MSGLQSPPIHSDGKGMPLGDLLEICPGRVRFREPMSRWTTLRIGGPADALVHPASEREISRLIRWAREHSVPWYVMGRGSNLLVLDGGVRGVVLRIGPPMDRVERPDQGDGLRLRCQAGLKLSRLLGLCVRNGWRGMEALVGIPGFLGGAISMNAGTKEGTIEELVEEITLVDDTGGIRKLAGTELRFSYRHLDLPARSVITSALLRLERGESQRIRTRLREAMKERIRRQPSNLPSAGSIFKNPPGDSAGRIIDRLGLKGLARGKACVSGIHGNFVINMGGAKAADVLEVIEAVRRDVFNRTGIRLELEVRLMGVHG